MFVESWSTISELPSVEINLSKEAVPVRCTFLIKQSEEGEQMVEDEIQDMLDREQLEGNLKLVLQETFAD
jgi:hypothetical protein